MNLFLNSTGAINNEIQFPRNPHQLRPHQHLYLKMEMINSNHWNPAKYAFIEDDMGFSVSYTPWLRALVPDINLAYLSGYKKIDKNQTIGFSLLYFSLWNIIFTNMVGEVTGEFNPNEFSIDGTYAR